jgi:hypothetical protein
MAKNNEVMIKLLLEGNRAYAVLDNGEKKLLNLKKSADNMNVSLKNVAAGMGLAFGASEVLAFLKSSVEEVEHQTRALQQLNQVLKTTGGVSGLTAGQLQQMAGQMEEFNRFKFDDKVIMDAQGLLLTFTRIGQDAFPRALQLAMDLSVRFDQDLRSSIIQVGKALNEPVKGVTALSRAGVQFTDVQKDMIAKFIQQNNLAEAQKVIMDELTTQVGGAAKESVTEYAEAVGRLGEAWEALKISLGGNIVIPALTYLVEETNKALDRWEYTIARIKYFFGGADPREGWGINKNADMSWIPAVKNNNQGNQQALVWAQKNNQVWTNQNKTVGEIRDKIKEYKAELEDTVLGSAENVRLTKEIARLEELISTSSKKNSAEKKEQAEKNKALLATEVDILKAKKEQAQFDLTGTDLYKDGNGDYASRKAAKGFNMSPKSVPSFTPVTQTQQELQDTLKLKESYNMVGEAGQEAFERTADAMAGTVQLFKDNDNFAKLFINTLTQIVLKVLILQWVSSMVNLFGGLFGGGGAGRSDVMSGGAQPIGGVNIGPVPFAKGGIVTSPTLAMIGEAGSKEAVIPLERLHQFTGGASLQPLINVMERQNQKINAWAASLRMEWDGKDFVTDSGKAKQRYDALRY